MVFPIFSYLPLIAFSIGGIVVGVLALRRHKRAALLTIIGWSLSFVGIASGIASFNFRLGSTVVPLLNLLTMFASLARYVCIFLGIYLLLERTTPSKFFTLKYNGLDLSVEKERGS